MTSIGPLLAMLHEGGWDEMLMVGVGLVLAYLIIVLTGRKGRDDDALNEDAAEADAVEADEPRDARP